MTAECKCTNLRSLISVDYPGIVKNLDKALETLDGVKTVENVFNSPKDRLELTFRKQDPYAHPTHGDRVASRSLLVRFKRRRMKKSADNPDNSSQLYDYRVEVVGKIQTTFKFETLAEFQWLPMTRKNISGTTIDPEKIDRQFMVSRSEQSLNPTYTSIIEELIPSDPFDGTLKTLNPDSPLLILPAVFSRFDTPNDNVHVPQPKFRSQEMRDEYERQNRLSIIGKTRKKRSTLACLISWNDPVPQQAPEKVIRYYNQLPEFEKKMIPRVEACFNRQPIWSRAALCYELGCTVMEIRYILPIVAFHYTNGPFRTMWVKYNYNPTIEKSSKIYQTLDFRFKRAYCNRADNANIYAKRSIYQYQLPKKKSRQTTHTDLRSSLINSRQMAPMTSWSEELDQQESMIVLQNSDQLYEEVIETEKVQDSQVVPAQPANNEDSCGHPEELQQDDDLSDCDIINEESIDFGHTSLQKEFVKESMFKFRDDLLPAYRQLSYQLKDIELDEVQSIVHKNDGHEPEICSEKDGWCSEGVIEKIRRIMAQRIDQLLSEITSDLQVGDSTNSFREVDNGPSTSKDTQ